jgi:hypothetical protein
MVTRNEGDIPWDNILEILVVNFGVGLLDGLVDGIVG